MPHLGIVIPDKLDIALEELMKARPRLSKSRALTLALEKFLDEQAAASKDDGVEVDFTPSILEGRTDRELGLELQGVFEGVYDFIPPVLPRGDTVEIGFRLSKSDARRLEVLLAEPGIRHKTKSDLVRSLVHYGLEAIDHMRQVAHPSWRAATSLGNRRIAYERLRAAYEDICQASIVFRDTLNAAMHVGEWQAAVDEWLKFYEDALAYPEIQKRLALKVLVEMPAAQMVAYTARQTGLIPQDYIPEVRPKREDLDTSIGVPLSQDELVRKVELAAYKRGLRAKSR